MATASGVVATGADFLQRENLDGNLRRVNSSSGEDTLIDLEEHIVEGTVYETDQHAGDKKLIPQYRLVAHGSDAQNPIQTSPPTINLNPILAQAIDTGTGLALGLYLGTLCYMLPSTFAIGRSPLGSSLFIVAKSLNYAGQIIDHVWRLASSVAEKRDSAQRRRITGEDVPKVDIIVTTYNEIIDNVVDTIAAAAGVDYPRDRFRVIVSDDGADGELSTKVQELNARFLNIIYFARDKSKRSNGSEHHGSKAGNVNDCIHFAKQLDKEPAEYYICLDADMIVERDTLRALVAHVANTHDVAMVTLPQHFYNLPANDPLSQNMVVHAECDEVLRDRLEAAWCPGSGFLIRSQALAELGGFPETSIAEDVLFSWILQGHGWKTVYNNEKLQFGLQPNSLASHIGQRLKWGVGHTNNSIALRFCLWHKETKSMSKMQRWAAVSYCVKPWMTLAKFISWALVALCLCLGHPVVAAMTKKDMRVLLIVHCVFWMFTRLNEVSLSRAYGYWALRRQTSYNIWMSPYLTLAIMREWVLPTWLGGHQLGFTSTGSMRAAVDERNSETRGGLLKRLWTMNGDTWFVFHLSFLGLVVYAIIRNAINSGDRLQLLQTALFPGMGFEQLPAFMDLLLYACSPPTDVPRRSLMEQDEKGIWRPKKNARGGQWTASVYLQEVPQAIVTLWAFAAIMLFV